MVNSQRGLAVLIGFALLFLASAAWAEKLPGPSIPDALYLDIETAPGYLWMNGCGEMGAAKSQPATLALDLSIGAEIPAIVGITTVAATAPTLATAEAHVGHHPGQGALTVTDVIKSPGAIERELAELSLALAGISNSLYWGK